MTELDELAAVLQKYLSPAGVRAVLDRALHERGLTSDSFVRSDLYKIRSSLQRGIRLFASDEATTNAMREIAGLCSNLSPRASPCAVNIRSENDVSAARTQARRLCEDFGARSYAIQKVTTIVSELARNIVSYTSGGRLEIVPLNGRRRRIVVRAIDSGPGIPHADQVLAGSYQSKSGLGRGLAGTQRLADHFELSTGSGGTVVVAEVAV